MSDTDSVSTDGSSLEESLTSSDSDTGSETDSDLSSSDDEWEQVFAPEMAPESPYQFQEDFGPIDPLPVDSLPVDYFLIYCTIDPIRKFVTETNRYAAGFIEDNVLTQHSRARKWFPTTITEMKGFLALILNMGIIRLPSIADYWCTRHSSIEIPWFRKMFNRDRFQLLMKFFHVVDNKTLHPRDSSNYNPAGKFQPVVDHHANSVFKSHYLPSQFLSIDESLVGTRGRSSMVQYMHKRHSKFGIKLWMLMEKDCCVCSDRKSDHRKRSKTVCVVCSKGLHLHCAFRHKHSTGPIED